MIALFLLTLPAAVTRAYHIQLRVPQRGLLNWQRQLVSRAPEGLTLNDSADISYFADIVLGNQTFAVLVDTGSSDLWVAGTVPHSTDAGLNVTIKYAGNSVTGRVKQNSLNFAGHSIADQAFLEISSDAQHPEGHGILGLGPSSGSFITRSLPSATGATVLDRVFAQNRSIPNYFTILLGRQKDPTDFFRGNITVGEVLPDFAAIVDEPRLAITKVPDSSSDDQHLQILLDPDGIIGPDGQAIPVESSVLQTVNKKQATVVLDCGFTLPQLPRSVVDAIYSGFSESEYREVPGIGGAYVLPCEQEVNITFKFSGKAYPIHPLDMTLEPLSIKLPSLQTSDGQKACIGTFQPFTYDRGSSPNYDMVLGMAFMRNVYSLFDYGDFVKNSTDLNNPYVQLLSITDMVEAHQDFVTVRLGGIDSTGTRALKDTTFSASSVHKTVYYIIVGVVVGAVLFAVAIFFLLRARKRR
ncbi:aspartic peptidase domain-containing protein [Flammula alnicola]|nr:aspartic peptidase domain-containing protein [Flammula alnicola]